MNPTHGHGQEHPSGRRSAATDCRSATAGGAIPAQMEACQAFARQHGYRVPEAPVCIDDGFFRLLHRVACLPAAA
jgi:hypothetical protein